MNEQQAVSTFLGRRARGYHDQDAVTNAMAMKELWPVSSSERLMGYFRLVQKYNGAYRFVLRWYASPTTRNSS